MIDETAFIDVGHRRVGILAALRAGTPAFVGGRLQSLRMEIDAAAKRVIGLAGAVAAACRARARGWPAWPVLLSAMA